MRRLTGVVVAVLSLALAPSAAGQAQEGEHSANMRFVGNIPYEPRNGGVPNFGTDIEFGEIAGRRYAFAGSYDNGMQIVDVTDPEAARRVGVYDCGVTQGDVQVFRQADEPGRVFASYASDTWGDGASTCYREAAALGFEVRKPDGTGRNGTFIADVTDPANPRTVSFVEVEQGSHNQTIHPSGDYLYNSNADLITSLMPAIEVFDISNLATPHKVGELDLPTRPGLGTESHDITFDDEGDRAYSAALSQGVIIDTADPAQPSIVSTWLDPTINVWHQSDPVTVGGRDFVLVEDELAGAAGGPVCPSGGFHVYEVTGDKELAPEKVGYWNIDDAGFSGSPTGTCTAHVFDVHEDEQIMTVAFYNGGVRVVDLSGLAGVSLGSTAIAGDGMREIGRYRFPDADTWSAKTPAIDPASGDFHLFGNDIARGLDVYAFDGQAAEPEDGGTWLSAAEARVALATRPKPRVEQGVNALFCLAPR